MAPICEDFPRQCALAKAGGISPTAPSTSAAWSRPSQTRSQRLWGFRYEKLLNARKNLSPNQLHDVLKNVIDYGLQEKKPGPTSATIAGFRRMIGWNQPVHIASYD